MNNSMGTRKQKRFHTAFTVAISGLWLVLASPASPALESAEGDATWSVPVRVFTAASAAPAAAPTVVTPANAAVASSLPPQYQTAGRAGAAIAPQPNENALRFIVTLVAEPILVEARITVDGEPFRMLREKRIDKLLEELSRAEPMAVQGAGSAEATPEATATAEAPPQATKPPEKNAQPEKKVDTAPKPADNSIVARLRRYAAATKRPPSREEVRWLLTNWADGPSLLLLDENYQRVRGSISPLFKVLDRDDDQVLSSAEIAAAEESLHRYDVNQDETLSLAELNKAAERIPVVHGPSPVTPPLIPIEQLVVSQSFRRLRESYQSSLKRIDRDENEVVSESELAELRTATPDLIVEVAFDSRDPTRSRLNVSSNKTLDGESKPTVRETSLTFRCATTLLELSAAQSPNPSDTDQISLGAVRDGFPLLPEIDKNEDGRLTIRELRQISKGLASFDRDGDGAVTKTETLPTMRVSFGLGPIVHRQLATVRSVHPATAAAMITPPEWFTRMDRNQDGDLTAREFLGGKEQFALLDTDQDQLISATEALAKEK